MMKSKTSLVMHFVVCSEFIHQVDCVVPCRIGLITENHPGITDDMQSGSTVEPPLIHFHLH